MNCNFRLSTYNLNANMPAEVIVQLLNTELAQKLLILHVNVFTGIGILANISSDRSYVVLNVKYLSPVCSRVFGNSSSTSLPLLFWRCQ